MGCVLLFIIDRQNTRVEFVLKPDSGAMEKELLDILIQI